MIGRTYRPLEHWIRLLRAIQLASSQTVDILRGKIRCFVELLVGSTDRVSTRTRERQLAIGADKCPYYKAFSLCVAYFSSLAARVTEVRNIQ
jgi:hypothetical protein